ncbi:MAG: hypothetical protein GXP23_05120 [Gammaproteobacteria bacterium]|nr:hypothetical protein [Gammaproteobacteria bacterium]
MSTLVEITGDDIAALGDADLRDLIGLLCEADYRFAGLPTKGIKWGGHQDAADGGLDVVVRDNISPPVTSFVPKNITGFQVKKPDMPRAEIIKEMCPKGILRASIKALIQENGAYIIVSSTGSTTDKALENRIHAMKEAVANEINHENLHLEFLDRGRIATWVRSHPSMILWVRNKIGKPLKGWRPYENWANAPGGIDEEYLLDDGLRLHDGAATAEKGLSVEDGLLKLCSALSTPGTSVRLTGLSGVGKTRLVQALFDNRVGENALNQYLAIYTDISDSPAPDPVTIANQLINDKTRAILIIDNCPPDLHHRLTKTCSRQQSTVSLLTVEYDVRDDLPEETSVFRLEPASEEIIEKLINKRFAHIGQVDARTIASFSGGNARVAIALANTVQQGETLSGFRNDQLFERLFWQRHNPNKSMLVSAQVCSLVYSFEGTDTSSEKSEIKFLASLVGKSCTDLYRDISEFKERNLVQSRSVWRAVLPHAIANRLARRALESIPKDTIVDGFIGNSKRLIRSFTRRLSYLHDCDAAIDIVNDWLDQDGWIGKSINNLNSLGINVLNNIAPVSPGKTLEAIERVANGSDGSIFTSRNNTHFSEFVRLLRHLAYDPALFDRSVELLCRYALSEDKNENNNSTRDVLKSLFYIYLSGTHASIEARTKVVENLLESEDQDKQDLGLLLLDAALETWHFSASHEFGFGAWPRDYGYHPNTQEEITRWFGAVIRICMRAVLSDRPISEQAKKLLANNLRGLWTKGGMFDALEDSTKKILEQGAWNDGWIAVRGIIRFDSKGFDDEVRGRLYKLEKLLKPNNLLEKARTFALSGQHGTFNLEDDFDDDEEDASAGYRRAEETTRKIGVAVAQDAATWNALLPDLVSTHTTRLASFGMGLAEGSSDKKELFQTLYGALVKTPPEVRQISALLGFLSSCAKIDSPFYNATLDDLVKDDVLGEYFPIIQTTSTIDQRGIERLHEALDIGKAPVHQFNCLAWGSAHEPINDDDLAQILRKILSKEGGVDVALEILNMRFHGRKKNSSEYSGRVMTVAQDMLSAYSFGEERRRQNNHDYELAEVVSILLDGSKGIHAATIMCQNLKQAISENRAYSFDYPRLLNKLAEVQPTVFLDIFLKGDDVEDYQRQRMFIDDFERHENPLSQISDSALLSWCEKDPPSRYPLVASVVKAFKKSDETGKYEWKPFVYRIFDKAPVLEGVLENLADALRPRSWSGSRADILQRRAVLYQELYEHDNEEVRAWARSQHTKLQEEIRNIREREDQRDRARDESFE